MPNALSALLAFYQLPTLIVILCLYEIDSVIPY